MVPSTKAPILLKNKSDYETISDIMMNVQCPNCHKTVLWSKDSPFRPFCSERCRLIDLGAWADGSYSIPTPLTPEEAESFEDLADIHSQNIKGDSQSDEDNDNDDKNNIQDNI